MQILTIILPFSMTTSNIALSCKDVRRWLSNNGFPTKSSKGGLGLENFSFYKYLNCPGIDEWMGEEIFRVIEDDNVDELKLLLQGGVNVESKGNHESTALIKAALNGRTECLKLLLQSGADTEAKNKYGCTALIYAATKLKSECLKVLLENKADLKAKDNDGWTALISAAYLGRSECLKLLLEYGADPEERTNYERKALVGAASFGKVDCLQLLLQYGAKVSPEIREQYPQYAHMW